MNLCSEGSRIQRASVLYAEVLQHPLYIFNRKCCKFQKTQSYIDRWSRHPLLTAMILNPKLSAWQDIKYGSDV